MNKKDENYLKQGYWEEPTADIYVWKGMYLDSKREGYWRSFNKITGKLYWRILYKDNMEISSFFIFPDRIEYMGFNDNNFLPRFPYHIEEIL